LRKRNPKGTQQTRTSGFVGLSSFLFFPQGRLTFSYKERTLSVRTLSVLKINLKDSFYLRVLLGFIDLSPRLAAYLL
ncbi:MAG: hypothetical protein Q6K92_04910, partial [Thermostichus sp. DG_1_5_bins_95]